MKTSFIQNCAIMLMMVMFTISCNKDVDFGEQYKKTVFIVNSNNMLYQHEHLYETTNDVIILSVYCASSEPITSDLQVRLMLDPYLIDSLNTKSLLADTRYEKRVMLPEANFTLDPVNATLTIKAGEQYGTLSIPFTPDGLDPDVHYSLPVWLVSNSDGYDINHDLQGIVYEPTMSSQFSGTFAGSSSESETEIRSVQPTLKAMSPNTVRMPIHNLQTSEAGMLETNYMLLTINIETGSVSITPWKNSTVVDLGGSTYDAATMTYTLNYSFTTSDSKTLTITEVITNSEYEDPDGSEN